MTDAATLGARIRAIRERAGVKALELAEHLDLDPSAMSLIESGRRNVRPAELAAIAEFLNVSQLALLDESSLVAQLPVSPRAVGGVERASLARLTALAELHEVLAGSGLPAEPMLHGVPDVTGAPWLTAASTLACHVLDQAPMSGDEVDPFLALVRHIEESFAIDVLIEETAGSNLIGAAITHPEFPLIFVDAGQPTPRALFTLAHELAHVLVMDGTSLSVDTNLTSTDDAERLANAFAAALLMPEPAVREHIDRYGREGESLARMVLDFGVSFESLVYRLHNLRIINAQGRDKLRGAGWGGLLQAVDDDLKRDLIALRGSRPERRAPKFLTMRAINGALRGVVGPAPVAGLLGVSLDDADALLDALEAAERSVITADYSDGTSEADDEALYAGSPI